LHFPDVVGARASGAARAIDQAHQDPVVTGAGASTGSDGPADADHRPGAGAWLDGAAIPGVR
jgi:hypothetical protein